MLDGKNDFLFKNILQSDQNRHSKKFDNFFSNEDSKIDFSVGKSY